MAADRTVNPHNLIHISSKFPLRRLIPMLSLLLPVVFPHIFPLISLFRLLILMNSQLSEKLSEQGLFTSESLALTGIYHHICLLKPTKYSAKFKHVSDSPYFQG